MNTENEKVVKVFNEMIDKKVVKVVNEMKDENEKVVKKAVDELMAEIKKTSEQNGKPVWLKLIQLILIKIINSKTKSAQSDCLYEDIAKYKQSYYWRKEQAHWYKKFGSL